MNNKVIKIISIIMLIVLITGCKNNSFSLYEEKDNGILKEVLGYPQEFVCNDIINKDFYFRYSYIYVDNKIYNQGPLYSNNQNCKEIDNISYDRYVIINNAVVGDIFIKDNKAYILTSPHEQKYELKEYGWTSEFKDVAMDDGVISISLESYAWDDKTQITNYNLYVLKDDGNVYLYKTKNHKIISKDEIAYSKEQYGNIKYFFYNSDEAKTIENIILLSDKGLYNNEIINSNECNKYADISCKYEFKLNSKYEKIKDRIIFINKDYIVDDEYNLYYNEIIDFKYIA